MKVITGGAGFIGSCIVSEFNQREETDLIVVDHFQDQLYPESSQDPKARNLNGKKFVKYFDKTDFIDLVKKNGLESRVDCVIHMGACSSTTEQDAGYLKENNFEYTRVLANWCLKNDVRFIYASSAATYGDGSVGYKDDEATARKCQPLNLYGQSKQDFDLWAFDNQYFDQIVGLKFFNVFGPNEYHKKDMRSVINKAYDRVVGEGKMALFKSYRSDYAHGEQKRDFIYIKDAVDVVMFFYENLHINGLFNVGTGKARTWNDVAHALFSAVGKSPQIEYIEMPEYIRDKYQYFTEADMSKLRSAGYVASFTELEDAVREYAQYLQTRSCL